MGFCPVLKRFEKCAETLFGNDHYLQKYFSSFF